MRTRFGDPAPRRVVLFRALQLGDLLCTVPALRALRAALPEAHIVLVGLPWARILVERFPAYLDGFLEFSGYPGLPEQTPRLDRLPAFLEAVRAEAFDLAIQMHGCGTITNPAVVLFGARTSAGFYQPGQYCPDPGRFLAYPERVSEVWRLLRLMSFLGAAPRGEHLEFPVLDRDRVELAELAQATGLRPGDHVCVHAGARGESRRWSPQALAIVADALARRGLQVVLTGTADDRPLTQALTAAMHEPAIDLAGRTSLGALAALLESTRLLICPDTGVSHLAAALRVPSVIVLPNMSEVEAWLPRDHLLHQPVSGVNGITPDDVLERASALLIGERGERTPCCTG